MPTAVTPIAPADAAIFETFVVPRYLRHFGDLLLDMLAPPYARGDAIVAFLACRTGYPDRFLVQRLGPTRLVGVDASIPALELATAKAATIPDLSADYRTFEGFPSPLPDASFTHAIVVHPPTRPEVRWLYAEDALRILVPGGQLVMALPLRGSFVEITDLLREYGVKHDVATVVDAVDASIALRPTPEALGEELERLGLVDVDVDFRTIGVPFQSGRDLLEDPTMRLLLLPELAANLGLDEETQRAAFAYVREAIDRYWAEGGFELTLHVGAVRGFRG